MSSKQKDKRSWMVALVPLFSVGGMSQPRWEEAIFISDAKARSAILQALGSLLASGIEGRDATDRAPGVSDPSAQAPP